MVKRFNSGGAYDMATGEWAAVGPLVLASDYDALAEEYEEYRKCDTKEVAFAEARISALEAALRKARNVWHNYRIDSTSVEDDVLREIDALLGLTVETEGK